MQKKGPKFPILQEARGHMLGVHRKLLVKSELEIPGPLELEVFQSSLPRADHKKICQRHAATDDEHLTWNLTGKTPFFKAHSGKDAEDQGPKKGAMFWTSCNLKTSSGRLLPDTLSGF